MADDVWLFDFKTGTTQNLTNNPAQDICPMWGSDNRIYFISDRDGRMNLFSTDLTGKETKQLTMFKDYDIKFPSIGKDAVVFEQAGYIWRYDLASGKAAPVPIDIKEDLASGRSAFVDASKHVESIDLGPDGQRLVVVARGDLFSVPMKEGSPRNLTKTSNVHERDAVWSPDGKWIAYNSDATGENELYVRSQDGKGQPQQITSNADTYYYKAIWSPDSKKLLWSDRLQRLRYVDVTSKVITEVDQDKTFEIRGYDWSPDSQWIAWARPEENGGDKIYLYAIADRKITAVTDDWYSSDNPTFSDDGKYLMLTSSRDFKPIFGQTDFSNVYRDLERVYLITLSKETEHPLAPRSDEVGKKKEKDKDKDKDKDADKKDAEKKPDDKKADAKDKETKPPKKPVIVKMDTDGIQDRMLGLEIPPGDYRDLRMVDDRIFYLRRTIGDDRGDEDEDQGADNRKSHLCF
jgi:tricorn protease